MLRAIITVGSALVVAGVVAVASMGHDASAASLPRSAGSPGASELANYPAVAQALTQGADVEITTDLQQCTTTDGQPGPDIIGGLHISAFEIDPGHYIAFSDTHQTLDPQNASITQFIRYTVTPDGATTVATTTLSASGQVVGSTIQLDCSIGKGAYFNW
jgi:hypothetical protein